MRPGQAGRQDTHSLGRVGVWIDLPPVAADDEHFAVVAHTAAFGQVSQERLRLEQRRAFPDQAKRPSQNTNGTSPGQHQRFGEVAPMLKASEQNLDAMRVRVHDERTVGHGAGAANDHLTAIWIIRRRAVEGEHVRRFNATGTRHSSGFAASYWTRASKSTSTCVPFVGSKAMVPMAIDKVGYKQRLARRNRLDPESMPEIALVDRLLRSDRQSLLLIQRPDLLLLRIDHKDAGLVAGMFDRDPNEAAVVADA